MTNKTKGKPGEIFLCVKCSKNIKEDNIECESCLKWEHRFCLGIFKEEYEVLRSDLLTNIMFFCGVCRLKVRLTLKFFNDIEEKQKMVGEMVKPIEEKLKSLNTKISQSPNQSNTLDASSVPSQNDRPTTVEAESRPSAPKSTPSVMMGILPAGECKFNLVIYGIAVCPKATPDLIDKNQTWQTV